MAGRNVLGGTLAPCGIDPVTGFYRDGTCTSGRRDLGMHSVCALMTKEFLDHQRARGNDLITPVPAMAFPGLKPGDSWCVTVTAWQTAYRDGVAPPVVLAATNAVTLHFIPLDVLRGYAADAPDDAADLT